MTNAVGVSWVLKGLINAIGCRFNKLLGCFVSFDQYLSILKGS
jgi:hypothetical protein